MIGFLDFMAALSFIMVLWMAAILVVRRGRSMAAAGVIVALVVCAAFVWVRIHLHEHRDGQNLVLVNDFDGTETVTMFTDTWYQDPYIVRMIR